MGTDSTDFRAMGFLQFPEKLGAFPAELHIDIAPVLQTVFSCNEILRNQAVNQPNCAVVSHLELVRQLADGDAFPLREAFDSEQGLMLARCQSSRSSRFLAKLEKLSQMVSEGG